MSAFITKLWEDIFTPGPTPTILKATNASFAALQLVLFALLLATYSIHCVILSILCAGLWASINWFANELYAAQSREREEQASKDKLDQPSDGDDDASETEVEASTVAPLDAMTKKPASAPASAPAPVPEPVPAPAAPAAAGLEPIDARGEVKHRPGPGTQSSVSTEDEWEKVSENENDKDK
ncbi:ER protein Pkr1-domain-containing protein [Thelonectria olida]|uniref:ER protein Pkr1-domain-containing protein n=1 Tax=Thelonectria olida TaxID=1576542 RepID=A0A9P9AYH8_9HYPO|nr:ER protein Pkr1-domain-containing protein [Thelonectria olida]